MKEGEIWSVPIWQFVATWVIAACAIGGLVISVDSSCEAEKATQIAEANIKPALEVSSFISYSVDIRAEVDKERIDRDKVSVIPMKPEKSGSGRRYAWLLIQNKGNGFAEILSIKAHYELSFGKPMVLDWSKGVRFIGAGGEMLAVPLGVYSGTLSFKDEVRVTYKSSLGEPTPLLAVFKPDDISDYVLRAGALAYEEL